MRIFFKILKFESKRNFNRIPAIVAVLFILAGIVITQIGINKLKRDISNGTGIFITEQKKLDRYNNTAQFGFNGVRFLSKPTKLFGLYYNCNQLGDLHSFIDSSFRLTVYKPQKGANVFKQPFGKNNLDFSWFYLIFFSAVSILYGFPTLRHKEFNKMLQNFADRKTRYISIILCRILFMLAFLLSVYGVLVAQFHLNGLSLSGAEITNLGLFFLVVFGVNTGFLLLGSIFGTFKSLYKGAAVAILSWFVLIILVPEIIGSALSNYTESLFQSVYIHELKKLEIFSNAEKKIIKEVSKYKTPAEIKKAYERMIRAYLETDFQEILKLEEKMLRDTVKAARIVHLCSIFTPATFYKTVGSEISGSAYNGHIAFYRNNIRNYKNFVRYCLENTTKRIRPKDLPFIKNKRDYVFHLKSSLPRYFSYGLLLTSFYFIITLFFSYYRFKKSQARFPEKSAKNLHFKFLHGAHYSFSVMEDCPFFPDLIYKTLLGQGEKIPCSISIDGKTIKPGQKQDILYLPQPDVIPGEIKTGALIDLLASKTDIERVKSAYDPHLLKLPFAILEESQRVTLMVNLISVKKSKIYVFDNLFYKLEEKEIEKILENLKKKTKDLLIVEFFPDLQKMKHTRFDQLSKIYLEDSFLKETFFKKYEIKA